MPMEPSNLIHFSRTRELQRAREILNALHIEVTSPVLENTYLGITPEYFISTMQFTGHIHVIYYLRSRLCFFFTPEIIETFVARQQITEEKK